MKKIAALCNAEKRYYLLNQKNVDGETVYQWLGDGCAFYPLVGLPYMEMENICAMFDITEKKQENLFMQQIDARETIWKWTKVPGKLPGKERENERGNRKGRFRRRTGNGDNGLLAV